VWRGKSNAREPGRFLVPVLTDAYERARTSGRRLVLDFSPLDYMNSSTFTPIVKLLDHVKRTAGSITLEFDPSRKWQALSFGALRTFETTDGRIAVRGK
jgi:anti-anti-sigma regulatory factor